MKKNKILSFDAETNGLWGQAFAVSAILMNENGEIEKQFVSRCPIEEEINPWVAENVLPQMEGIQETASSYKEMLSQFAEFYLANKDGADVIVHMGLPVEAKLFIDMHTMGIIGDWDAPYPLIDISAFPEISDSVDGYNAKHGLDENIPNFDGGTHNPLYDSYAAAVAYRDITNC